MMIRANLGNLPRRRVGRQVQVWNPVNGRWEVSRNGGLGQATGSQAWCDSASAWNPVAWFACFGSDVKKVTSAFEVLPTPPPAAPPGAPCQDPSNPACMAQLTVPGAFTPDMSAQEAHDNSIANWQNFFQTNFPGTGGGGPTNDQMNTFFLIVAAVVVLYLLIPAGGRKR
jgi:hypothetical protein